MITDHRGKLYVFWMILLSIIFMAVLPAFGLISVPAGLLLTGAANAVLIYLSRAAEFNKKNNLDKLDLKESQKLFEHSYGGTKNRSSEETSKKQKVLTLMLIGALVIFLPLLVVAFNNLNYLEQVIPLMALIGFFMVGGFLVLFSVFMLVVKFTFQKVAYPKFEVYKSGIRYYNNFFEWNLIESMDYMKYWKFAKVVSAVNHPASRSYMRGNQLKIKLKDKTSYIVKLLDRKGFENALKKAGKSSLLK